MMSKFRRWLYQRFLPAYCRDDLMDRNARQAAIIRDQRVEIERLQAYIGGMEAALRHQPRRIIVENGVRK